MSERPLTVTVSMWPKYLSCDVKRPKIDVKPAEKYGKYNQKQCQNDQKTMSKL